MLNDATGFSHIYLCTGYTDLRNGIDGLIAVVNGTFGLNSAEEGSKFLFLEEKQIASRHYFMKATDGFCVTKGLQAPDVFSGPGMRRRQNNCHYNSFAG